MGKFDNKKFTKLSAVIKFQDGREEKFYYGYGGDVQPESAYLNEDGTLYYACKYYSHIIEQQEDGTYIMSTIRGKEYPIEIIKVTPSDCILSIITKE